MHPLLSDSRDIRINQQLGRVDSASLEPLDQLLVILPTQASASIWRALPQGSKLQELLKKRAPKSVPALQSRLSNKRQTLVIAGTIDASADAFEQLTLGRKLVAAVTAEKAGYRIKEVPVTWAEDERTSVTIVSTIAADLRGLARLRRTRPWRSAPRREARTEAHRT